MSFDLDQWLSAILASAQGTISTADLFEVGGLIEEDYLESDANALMEDIEAELDEAERQDAKKTPPGPPASS